MRIELGDGFVEDVAHMGDDAFISTIAGISHDSDTGPGVDKLLEWGHVSPLEFGQIVFHVKLPIFVLRQWMRHRAFSYMERSGRYTDMKYSDMYIPIRDGGYTPEQETDIADTLANYYAHTLLTYEKLGVIGLPKELQRIVMPLAMYTEIYVRMDIRHLREFLGLRLDKHAQYEIREYAGAIREIAREYFPQCLKGIV